MGFTLDEIANMEVKTGRDYIYKYQQEEYDKNMVDKIDMFSAHGVDVRKIQTMNDFINKQTLNKYDELEKKFKHKLNKKLKADPEIEKIINGQAIKNYGR